jgi:transcriptional regulator with XRE-family HTH domain
LNIAPLIVYGERVNVPHDDTASLSQHVAAEVRAHLARQRISGRRAALMLGWTPPYLSRRLTGEIPFDVDDLAKVADLLGVPIATFFDGHSYAVSPVSRGLRNRAFRPLDKRSFRALEAVA